MLQNHVFVCYTTIHMPLIGSYMYVCQKWLPKVLPSHSAFNVDPYTHSTQPQQLMIIKYTSKDAIFLPCWMFAQQNALDLLMCYIAICVIMVKLYIIFCIILLNQTNNKWFYFILKIIFFYCYNIHREIYLVLM